MARNGSGVYVRTQDWTDEAAANNDISSAKMDAEADDIATALSESIARDGQTTITANLPMATFRHTGVGNAQARTDYAAAGQVQDGGLTYAADSGAADAYAITLSPAVTAYAAGQTFRFKAANANTGASTLNVNSLGTKAIQKRGAALSADDIEADHIVEVTYDGTQFQMTSPETQQTPSGALMPYAGASEPGGWVFCDGSAYNSVTDTSFAALYAAIGNTYGGSDGTDFQVPDLRGRAVFGADNMDGAGGTGGGDAGRLTSGAAHGVDGDTVGSAGGVEEHALTEAELASHKHGINVNTNAGNAASASGNVFAESTSGGDFMYRSSAVADVNMDANTMDDTGSDDAHTNLPPALVLNYIIKK